jgi:hypothetical protein
VNNPPNTEDKQQILRGKHPEYPELLELRRLLNLSRDFVQTVQLTLQKRLTPQERREAAALLREGVAERKRLKTVFRDRVKAILGPDAWGKGQA